MAQDYTSSQYNFQGHAITEGEKSQFDLSVSLMKQ